jgi:hypothetical protein
MTRSRALLLTIAASLVPFAPTARAASSGKGTGKNSGGPDCKFSLTGDVTTLIKNADSQTVEVLASSQDCAFNNADKEPAKITAPSGQGPTPVRWKGDRLNLLRPLPAGTGDGSLTFEVFDRGDKSLGKLTAEVGSMVVEQQLGVSYDTSVIRHSGVSASVNVAGSSTVKLGIAVVGAGLQNQARLTVPPGIPRTSTPDGITWEIKESTWGNSVSFSNCVVNERSNNYQQCQIASPERITFRASDEQAGQLVVTLTLSRRNVASALMEVRLPVAASARRESVPLPFVPAVVVQCGDKDPAGDGDTIAIKGDAITLNTCYLYFEVVDCTKQEHPPFLSSEVIPALEAFGPQPLSVRVHKDGTDSAKDGEAIWIVNAASGSSRRTGTFEEKFRPDAESERRCKDADLVRLRLPQPQVEATGDGFYTVTVRLKVPPPAPFVYRDGTVTQNEETPRDSFTAKLRLRGSFAWDKPLRTFITVPVNATAIRFPANSVDLRSSSSPTAYQAVPFTAGVLFGIEHWDYRLGKNTWAVPLRALAGMQLINLTNANFIPSTMVGLSATFAVVDAPATLQSSLAVGLFWEVVLNEPHPLEGGGHVLLTLGFNFFSLGSPATPGK